MNRLSAIKRSIVFPVLLAVTACAPFVKDGQTGTATSSLILRAGSTVGQTFTARHSGLEGIEVFLGPETAGRGEIRLHLRADSQPSSADLAMGTLALQSISRVGWYRFDFSPPIDSDGKDYYLLLELKGTGQVRVDTAAGDTYLDGALYQNRTPVDAQMTFRLVYAPRLLLLGYLTQAGTWLGFVGIAIFLFILPGWALLMLFWPEWDSLGWGEKLGLAAAASLAVYPLLFLWTAIVGLHLGPLYAWLPPLAGLAIILIRYRHLISYPNKKEWFRHKLHTIHFSLYDLILLFVLSLILFTRFWVIHFVDVPMWGDGYQHTMIAQLLVDHGGLFNSWLPYADLQTLTYHFGFHAASAVFHWISDVGVPQAVLWTGQILNVLAVIALYPLATRVGKGNRWAGLVAVFVAGLLSPMPMYYVNWGRYTQLAGQVILPGVIYLAWVTLESRPTEIKWQVMGHRIPFDPRRMVLLWVVLGGLALTHYRVLIFALVFFVAFFILYVRRQTWRALLVQIFWIGIGAGLLFLPWFIHVFAGKILLIVAAQLGTPVAAVSTGVQEYNAIGDLSSYLPLSLWVLLAASIIWGLWRREKGVALVSLWWFFILLAANPQWLHLPGEGALTSFAVFIAAYIPAGVLSGYLLGQIANSKSRIQGVPISLALSVLVTVIVIVGGIWGARQRMDDLQVIPSALVTRPDIRAAEWVQENTPQDARFLVNSFFAYGDTAIVGSDGGWWLPLLAHRRTALPPLNYSSEQGPRPAYVKWINQLTAEIQSKGILNPEVLALLRARGIEYVYIGQKQGRTNYGGPYVLQPEQILSSQSFELLYHQDRVWVFKLLK